MVAERILAWFCKRPDEVGYDDPTDAAALARREVPSDPLKDLRREFPDLGEIVHDRDVLDFGCGFGDQAGALAREFGARVTGLDKHRGLLAAATDRYGKVARFTDHLDDESFDVVLSQDAMEHVDDPAAALTTMARALRPGGRILITFGPPWWAPYGAHMRYFCPIPWLQLWFSEETVMAVRGRYRHDGACHYEEVESGLNKLSLARFEQVVRESGLETIERHYAAVKKLQFLTRVPLVRELTTVLVSTVLTIQPSAPVGTGEPACSLVRGTSGRAAAELDR
jgi:ubiquinone/menaquinone biosynthesis C-methylase UbiE